MQVCGAGAVQTGDSASAEAPRLPPPPPRGTAKGVYGPPSWEEAVTQEVSRVWTVDSRESSVGHGYKAGILLRG